MQRLVPHHAGDRVGDLLRRCGDLEHETQLVRTDFLDRLERSHGAVLAVDADVQQVVGLAVVLAVDHLDSHQDALAQPGEPVVDLADDQRVAHRTDQNALKADAHGPFELDRVLVRLLKRLPATRTARSSIAS